MFTDDPVRDFLVHDRKAEIMRETWEASRPICNRCNKHILDDEAVLIGADYYCLNCIEEMTVLLDD